MLEHIQELVMMIPPAGIAGQVVTAQIPGQPRATVATLEHTVTKGRLSAICAMLESTRSILACPIVIIAQ
jgi:hypothetical protein